MPDDMLAQTVHFVFCFSACITSNFILASNLIISKYIVESFESTKLEIN